MRVAELTDTRLVVELSEWDLWELERSFGVCLPGGTWLIPGRMAASDGFCARADEMRVRGADGAFTGDGLDDAERLVVAEAVCSLWPWVCDSCDVRFVGEDGELWCRGGHHLKAEVRALRSSAWSPRTALGRCAGSWSARRTRASPCLRRWRGSRHWTPSSPSASARRSRREERTVRVMVVEWFFSADRSRA